MAISKKTNAMALFDNIQKEREASKGSVKDALDTQPDEAITYSKNNTSGQIIDPTPTENVTVKQDVNVKPVKKAEKNKVATFYLSADTIRMIKEASKAYGGNSSLYLRNLVGEDYMKNKVKYDSIPDIRF